MGTSESQSQSLEDALRELNNTLNKDEGIVNTSSSHRFLNQPEDIDSEYQEYARTHLVQPDIDRFIQSLVESLEDPEMNKSVPGYIVGPYGFGKTSTAGKVWYILEQEKNYITTPPIYFDDLQSIVDAVYGWMRYRLHDRPDFVSELTRVYEAKATNNIEDIVEQRDVQDKDQLKQELEDLLEAGQIDIDFSVNHVLEFLSECNQIAQEAGYDGLVVIADELQQFVSSHSSDKKAYSELRDLVKSIALGLNDGDGLGLLLTMDDGLHGDLDVNADDVLARLAEQNVRLNLSSVYARSFPADLWEELSQTFRFHDERHEIITEDALDAIGQICERGPPLSNGPRTVVDILTIAIEHWLSEGDSFNALDLANAYYNGQVRFKGDHIKNAITEAINADLINNSDRENFVKLCGVFPRGISGDRLKQYGVHEAKEDVKSELHGQIIITHEEGRTLKRLEREGEDRGIKDELFTQFYRDYDTTEIYHDNASSVFRDPVLSEELFPAVRGKSLTSWVTEHDFEPETGGVHAAVFRGSFNGQKYPERIIEIRTGSDPKAVKATSDGNDVDMTLGFVHSMEKNSQTTPHIERVRDDLVLFYLNFTDAFDSLPSNIAILEDYMSPEDVNPHLLLSLYRFMITWEESRTINPNQTEQLEYIRDQLVDRSVQKLFGPPLNADQFISDGNDGRRTIQPTNVVKKAVNKVIADLYPDYTTLYISDNYVTFLEDYESLLIGNDPSIRISQKRGNTPIEGTKSEIAEALGVSSNSTANTRLDKQYKTLIEKEVWSGQDARIRLKLHPLEESLKEYIEEYDEERVPIGELYDVAADEGYRQKEVDWALRLLDGREYIVRHLDDGSVELSDIAIDRDEVTKRHESLNNRAEQLSEVAESWDEYDDISTRLSSIGDDLEDVSENDIEILDDILAQLQDIERDIASQEKATHATYLERCKSDRRELKQLASETPPRPLNKTTEGANIPFGMHLGDIKTRLEADFQNVLNRAEEEKSKVDGKISSAEGDPSIESVEALQEVHETAKGTEQEIQQDFDDIEETASDYADWCDLAVEMSNTREEMVRYKDSHEDASRVKSLLNELNQQLQEIQTQFQKNDETILRNAGMHRNEFEDIENSFREVTRGDEEIFTYRKRVLENTVSVATDGHPSIRQNLNPNNAQGSRNDLLHEFRRQIRENDGGLDDVQSSIEKVESSLGYAELLNQVPDDPEKSPSDLRETLSDSERQLESIDNAIHEMDVQRDIQLPDSDDRSETFPDTDATLILEDDDEILDVGEAIAGLKRDIDQLNKLVTQWRQTTDSPPEGLKHIMEQLDYRERMDVENVLISIAEQSGGEVDLDEFFDELQELFEGNHITISLKSQHR